MMARLQRSVHQLSNFDGATLRPRSRLAPRRPVALAATALFCLLPPAQAQTTQDAQGLTLKSSPLLQERIPATARSSLPVFVTGDVTTGRTDLDTVVEGHAMLRRGDLVIRADRMEYYQPEDLAKLKSLGYNKLVLLSESPVRVAISAVNPGSRKTREYYPASISPTVDAWPVDYRSEDILIKEIPVSYTHLTLPTNREV